MKRTIVERLIETNINWMYELWRNKEKALCFSILIYVYGKS